MAGTMLSKNEQKLAYKLLLPTLIILFIIAFYPLGQVFYTSLTDKKLASSDEVHFVGLANYRELLGITIKELPPVLDKNTGKPVIDEKTKEVVYTRPIRVLPRSPRRFKELFQFSFFSKKYVIGVSDEDFIRAVSDTVYFTVASVLLELILGIGIALVVNSKFKGKGVMRAIMLIPWAVITVVSARIWEAMLDPSRMGLFNMILNRMGLSGGHISWLTNETLQMPSMIAMDVWKTTPFMALLLLAGLQLIPRDLYEAAEVDGASKLRQFFAITLPLLKPSIAVALVFRTLDALRVFDIFQVVLAQKRYSMATYNYYQLIGNRNMGMSSAIGVIIFFLIFIFAVIYMRMLGVDK